MRGSIRNPSAKCRHQRLSALLDDLPVGYPEQIRVGDRYTELALGLPQDDDDLVGGTASEVRRAAPNGRSRHPARIRENADQVQPVQRVCHRRTDQHGRDWLRRRPGIVDRVVARGATNAEPGRGLVCNAARV
jgi:hypothetical protein